MYIFKLMNHTQLFIETCLEAVGNPRQACFECSLTRVGCPESLVEGQLPDSGHSS